MDLVVYENTMTVLNCEDISDNRVKALLKQNNLLSKCYERWLIDDGEYVWTVRNNLLDFADDLIQKSEEKQKPASNAALFPEAFEYGSYHFIEAGKIPKTYSLKNISKYICSDPNKGLLKYPWGKYPYNREEFYEASGQSEMDVFKCLEDKLYYVPGENELFRYTGKITISK